MRYAAVARGGISDSDDGLWLVGEYSTGKGPVVARSELQGRPEARPTIDWANRKSEVPPGRRDLLLAGWKPTHKYGQARRLSYESVSVSAPASEATAPARVPAERIFSRSSAVMAGFSLRKARAFSLPWPR